MGQILLECLASRRRVPKRNLSRLNGTLQSASLHLAECLAAPYRVLDAPYRLDRTLESSYPRPHSFQREVDDATHRRPGGYFLPELSIYGQHGDAVHDGPHEKRELPRLIAPDGTRSLQRDQRLQKHIERGAGISLEV